MYSSLHIPMVTINSTSPAHNVSIATVHKQYPLFTPHNNVTMVTHTYMYWSMVGSQNKP